MSSLTPPTPPLSFLPSPTYPSPLFFPLALPTLPEPLPTLSDDFSEDLPKICRRCSPPIPSQEICDVIFGKYGRKGPMRQHNEILRFDDVIASGRRFSTTNQKPPFSEDFSEDFPNIFRRSSPPIRSQESCDVIFVKFGRKSPTVLLTNVNGYTVTQSWPWVVSPRTNCEYVAPSGFWLCNLKDF